MVQLLRVFGRTTGFIVLILLMSLLIMEKITMIYKMVIEFFV